MVDPGPPGALPPSKTRSIPAPRKLTTSSAVTHGGLPETFALVPVIGTPTACARFVARELEDRRIPILPVSAVRRVEMLLLAQNRSVRPPGQNLDMSFLAAVDISFT
jgi:hypothetical protein